VVADGLFFVAGVAQAAIVPLLPRLSVRFDLSASQTALLLALPGLATLAVSVPSGLAADRLGARPRHPGAGALLCLSCLAQAAPSLPALLLGRIVFGVAFGVVWTTGMAWLADRAESSGGSGLGASVTCSSVASRSAPRSAAFWRRVPAPGSVRGDRSGHGTDHRAPGRRDRRDRDRGPGGAAGAGGPAARYRLFAAGHLRPAGGDHAARADAVARRPRVSAAAGALVVSGAVSSASQLLVSGGLHRLGFSTGRIGLAFSAAAVCYIVVSAVGRPARRPRAHAALQRAGHGRAGVRAASGTRRRWHRRAGGGAPADRRAARGDQHDRVLARVRPAVADGGGDGLVFGMLKRRVGGGDGVMPVVAGALEQAAGARAAYLAVVLPAGAIAVWLITAAAERPLHGLRLSRSRA